MNCMKHGLTTSIVDLVAIIKPIAYKLLVRA